MQTEESQAVTLDDALTDARWLIKKLDILISENTTLRRMVGSTKLLI